MTLPSGYLYLGIALLSNGLISLYGLIFTLTSFKENFLELLKKEGIFILIVTEELPQIITLTEGFSLDLLSI